MLGSLRDEIENGSLGGGDWTPNYKAGVKVTSGVASRNCWIQISGADYHDNNITIDGVYISGGVIVRSWTWITPVPKGSSYVTTFGGTLFPCK